MAHKLFYCTQERDADNLPLATYTRGLDLSGSLEGAGGIGGLLARTDIPLLIAQGSPLTHAYYHADGNGNVTALTDGTQQIAARYVYDPYGNLQGLHGPLAELNPYRFSSKEWHTNAALYYFGYRFYEPALQRWLNRDPILESGSFNLFSSFANRPSDLLDPFGLRVVIDPGSPDDFRRRIEACLYVRINENPVRKFFRIPKRLRYHGFPLEN